MHLLKKAARSFNRRRDQTNMFHLIGQCHMVRASSLGAGTKLNWDRGREGEEKREVGELGWRLVVRGMECVSGWVPY